MVVNYKPNRCLSQIIKHLNYEVKHRVWTLKTDWKRSKMSGLKNLQICQNYWQLSIWSLYLPVCLSMRMGQWVLHLNTLTPMWCVFFQTVHTEATHSPAVSSIGNIQFAHEEQRHQSSTAPCDLILSTLLGYHIVLQTHTHWIPSYKQIRADTHLTIVVSYTTRLGNVNTIAYRIIKIKQNHIIAEKVSVACWRSHMGHCIGFLYTLTNICTCTAHSPSLCLAVSLSLTIDRD